MVYPSSPRLEWDREGGHGRGCLCGCHGDGHRPAGMSGQCGWTGSPLREHALGQCHQAGRRRHSHERKNNFSELKKLSMIKDLVSVNPLVPLTFCYIISSIYVKENAKTM